MGQREEQTMKEWIAATEVAFLGNDAAAESA